MDFYVLGSDKSLNNIDGVVMPLSGGDMTGNIGYNSGSRSHDMIRFISGDENGSGISIGDGGTTVIGGGDSAALLQPVDGTGAADKMIVASDTTIDFYTNCQNGTAGAAKVTLSTAGRLSGHQKAITYGTSAPSGGVNGDIYIQY